MGQIFDRIKRIYKSYRNDIDYSFKPDNVDDNDLKEIIDSLNQTTEKDKQKNTNNYRTNSNTNDVKAINAYKTLGISPNASIEEIKAAYKSLIKQYHPDRVQALNKEEAASANKKAGEINDAYNYLEKIRRF